MFELAAPYLVSEITPTRNRILKSVIANYDFQLFCSMFKGTEQILSVSEDSEKPILSCGFVPEKSLNFFVSMFWT